MNRPPCDPELLAYAKAFVDRPYSGYIVPEGRGTIFAHETVTTIVLDRQGQFQVELVIIHPDAPSWPGEHRHPHVDSIEIEVNDCKGVTRNGVLVDRPDWVHNGRYLVHLAPTDFHGVRSKPNGSSLLSVQKWIGMSPSSVGMDWEGEPVHSSHAAQQEQYHASTST